MPFKRTRSQPLSGRVNIRVTEEEQRNLKEAAEVSGLSISEYVRRRAVGYQVIARTDLALAMELRRIGGLLKTVHNESYGAYSETTMRTLLKLNSFLEQLSKGQSIGFEKNGAH